MSPKPPESPKISLYEITREMSALQTALEAEGGDVSEGSTGAQVLQVLTEYGLLASSKVENIGRVYRALLLAESAVKTEIDRLTLIKKAVVGNYERLKGYCYDAMKNANVQKIEGGTTKIWIQRNGGKPRIIPKVTPDKLPMPYRKVEYVADLRALEEDLNSQEIATREFASQWAEVADIGESLRIK